MKTKTKDLSTAWQICLMVMLVTIMTALPDFAFANNSPMGNVLCLAASWFSGNTGKGIATLAIVVIGIGALLGKVSWGMAMIVGTGVAIIFGASSLVNLMSTSAGTSAGSC